jgi:hypothetical protein
MSADPSSSPALRASDAGRDRAIELLHTAVANGRVQPGRERTWLHVIGRGDSSDPAITREVLNTTLAV